MNLAETLQQRLADGPSADRRTVEVSADGWTAGLTSDRSDAVGCLIWDLAVRRNPAPAEPMAVRPWGERIARRATGLLENLTLLEVDDARRQALLRSDEPARRGENVFYYELLLNSSGSASVRRYRASRQGGRREQSAFALTHEALAKLIGDLIAEQ